MLKQIWTHSMFYLVKMGFIIFVVIMAYDLYNGITFYWTSELLNAGLYTLIFWLVYCAAVALDYKRMQSSPFLLADTVCKRVAEQMNRYTIREGQRGLFTASPDSAPVPNPAELAAKFEAYIELLFAVDNGKADRLIAELRKLQAQAEYMTSEANRTS